MAQCEAVGQIAGRPNFGKRCQRAAVHGAPTCAAHGGRATTTTPELMQKRIDRQGIQCSRTKRDGERCKNSAVRGTTVCTHHGGNAPQTRAKARERLMQMVDPVLTELHRIVTKPDTSDADRLRAITLVLDRTGYSAKTEIEVEVKPWEKTMQAILKRPPAEMLVDLPEADLLAIEGGADASEGDPATKDETPEPAEVPQVQHDGVHVPPPEAPRW